MSAPANWYPDPYDGNLLRWWDGGAWTDQTVSLVAEKEVSAPEPVREPEPVPVPVPVPVPEPVQEAPERENLAERIAGRVFGAAAESAVTTRREAREELTRLREEIEEANQQLSDAKLFIEVGYREFEHPASSSVHLKGQLEGLRQAGRELQKKGAAVTSITLSFASSDKQGAVFSKGLRDMALSLYNAEAESRIKSTKSDPEPGLKALQSVTNRIDRFGKMIELHITPAYRANREAELRLTAEYRKTLEFEKEQEREHRARLREQERVEKEIAKAKAKLEKEAQHRRNVLAKLEADQLAQQAMIARQVAELEARLAAADEAARASILSERDALKSQLAARDAEVAEAKAKLDETEDEVRQVDFRAANTRAGYVYVISNIGAFGEGVVKIGMTRRLEPLDRVRELGGASVPFRFDTHALIFSDDAVALEGMLHKAFDDRRLNLVNQRREFFRASPKEVLQVLTSQNVNVVEFTEEAAAPEYRSTLQQRRSAASVRSI